MEMPTILARMYSEHLTLTITEQFNFREFMLALYVTSSDTPEEKLNWAFRMYDVDGSGDIEFKEMKR